MKQLDINLMHPAEQINVIIGPLQPMGDKEIDELRIAFNVK
ncbi:MAG: hypothetical protein PHD30_01205 [Paludibacter sp.]|nr:hypothetical protein [Paludibacter sp.]